MKYWLEQRSPEAEGEPLHPSQSCPELTSMPGSNPKAKISTCLLSQHLEERLFCFPVWGTTEI